MAVAVDAVSTAVVTGANVASYTGTANITVGTGLSNGALILQVAWGILPSAISVHWDSSGTNQLMTSIGAATNSTGIGRVELFGLIAPTSGNKNVSITWTGATSDIDIYAVSWTGVDQTGGATSFAHVTTANNQSLASNAVLTLNVTSAVNNAVIAGFNNDFAWASPTPCNQTQLFLSNGGTIADCANRAAGAVSVSMTATNGATADNACAVGCDIVAAAAGGAAPFYKSDWANQKDLVGLPPQAAQTNINIFTNPIPFNSFDRAVQSFLQPRAPDGSQQTNLNLFKNPIPFKQTDWPLMETFYKVPQTQAYNNLIYVTSVVAAPFYTQDFGTFHIIPDWASPVQYPNIVLQNFSTPFYTQDFSKPFVPTPAKQDQQSLNVNIFTNPIPFAQYDWSKPQSRTITPDVNLLNITLLNPVVTGTPFSQLSWPNTSVVPLATVDFHNMVLYTIATGAPFAQYDWSHSEFLPSVPSSPIVLNTNLFTNPIPFSQLDWTKYYPIHQITFDNLPNIALLNQVVTNPFFSQDFSRPFVPPRAAIDVQSVNTNLFTNPVPLNQIDWSKPYRIVPIASDQNSLPNLILYQPVVSNPSNPLGIYSWMDLYKYVILHPNTPALLQNLTLILPPPPPDIGPVGGWRWIDGVMRMREKELDRRDQHSQSADIKKAAAVLSKMGGIARAQALTANQRSNIASKAAQARWNPPVKRK